MLKKFLTTKWFLKIAGVILILVGVLGLAGVLGPTADKSVFGANWFFDNNEIIVHAGLGAACLLAGFVLPAGWQRYFAFLVAAVAIFFGVYSIFLQNFGPVVLQNPADTVFHLIVGIVALLFALMPEPPRANQK